MELHVPAGRGAEQSLGLLQVLTADPGYLYVGNAEQPNILAYIRPRSRVKQHANVLFEWKSIADTSGRNNWTFNSEPTLGRYPR
ncbi:hypothetical protein EVAR_84718_1 [Eumeta japonica]|uniref:Uncharacterized protein n=1 Tax=Eumeta variegata TaxID=151549 RepID=A0A4C1VU57_EUMVA|nr:hypothetical protein EVAR_84718_1 [Eumeta japonica]